MRDLHMMAAFIASGYASTGMHPEEIAKQSAKLALLTMEAVDKLAPVGTLADIGLSSTDDVKQMLREAAESSRSNPESGTTPPLQSDEQLVR